jgi:N-acetylneuraminate synthase
MIEIGDKRIGRDCPPFIVAEMSGNHNQSFDRAMRLVDAAAAAGAHALKLQTATPEGLTLDADGPDFRIADPSSPWNGARLFDLYRSAVTPWEWHEPIFRRVRELGMVAFSTPFEAAAIDLLERLDVPCYKIASFENVDLALIRRAAATGKPLLISTGLASVGELDEAVRAARSQGCRDLVLLKCTSSYPATAENANLSTLPDLRARFDCEVGLSDHTLGIGVAVASVALGAAVIEKHFTLRRVDGGVDSSFSMEPDELAQIVVETERAWRALGQVHYGPTHAERRSLVFRRSLYFVRDLAAGDVITAENVRAIRPGGGLAPKHLDSIVGKRVRCAVSRGAPVRWNLLE